MHVFKTKRADNFFATTPFTILVVLVLYKVVYCVKAVISSTLKATLYMRISSIKPDHQLAGSRS